MSPTSPAMAAICSGCHAMVCRTIACDSACRLYYHAAHYHALLLMFPGPPI